MQYNLQLGISNQLQQRINLYIQSEGQLKTQIHQMTMDKQREEKENGRLIQALHTQIAAFKAGLPQDSQRMLSEIENLTQRNMLLTVELAGYKKREAEAKKVADAEKLKLAETQTAKALPTTVQPQNGQPKSPTHLGLKIAFFGFCAVVAGGIYYLKSLGMF